MTQREERLKKQKPVVAGVPRALFEEPMGVRLPRMPRPPRFEYICRKPQVHTIVSPCLRVWM